MPAVLRPKFVPDPSLSREEMERLQRDIADAAVFADDFPVDQGAVRVDSQVSLDSSPDSETQSTLSAGDRDAPLIAGVDQAFLDDRAVSAVVLLREGRVVERAHAVEPVETPYVPGLLSFREGGAILSALAELARDPDVVLVDGSGRVHFRQAGLATHVGVTMDLPTVGVAKNLLCGKPRAALDDRKLTAGERVPVEADADVTAPDGTVIGHAVQTRQFQSENRYVNPLYVSPGHRVSAETATDIVAACAAGYKLPEPTRLADQHADGLKASVESA
jgi:deoxyribonuclease V